MSEVENEFPDLAPDPEGEAEPEARPPEGEGEAEAGEPEPRRFAGKFASPDELERSYVSAEQELGRLRNEVGEKRQLEQELDMYRRTYQPPPGSGEPQPDPYGGHGGGFHDDDVMALTQLTPEQWQEWYDENPVEATQAQNAVNLAVYNRQLEQRLAQYDAFMNNAMASDTINRLKAELGDATVMANREIIAEYMTADPAYFANPETRYQRMKIAVKAAEFDKMQQDQRQPQQPRAANGQFAAGQGSVHVEGGSGPQPSRREPDVDPEIAAIDLAGTQRDAFGALPRR